MGVDKKGSGQIGKNLNPLQRKHRQKKGVDEIGRRRIVWLICSLTCRLKKSVMLRQPSLPGYVTVLLGA